MYEKKISVIMDVETEIFEDRVTWSIFKDEVKEKLARTRVVVFNTQLDNRGNIAIISIMVSREIIYIFRIDLMGFIPKFVLNTLTSPQIIKVGFNLDEEIERFVRVGWRINTKIDLSDFAPGRSLRKLTEIISPETRLIDQDSLITSWAPDFTPHQLEYLNFHVRACYDIIRQLAGIPLDHDASFETLSVFKEKL
jgi:hypothetical protein